MTTDIEQYDDDNTSPFERLKHIREDGTEVWYGRELMPHAGYGQKWQNFRQRIITARNAISALLGVSAGQDHITNVSNMVSIGSGTTRSVEDFEMTRTGAYQVILACDESKPEVAAAKMYFNDRTQQAERAEAHGVPPVGADQAQIVSAVLADKAEMRKFFADQIEAERAHNKELLELVLESGDNRESALQNGLIREIRYLTATVEDKLTATEPATAEVDRPSSGYVQSLSVEPLMHWLGNQYGSDVRSKVYYAYVGEGILEPMNPGKKKIGPYGWSSKTPFGSGDALPSNQSTGAAWVDHDLKVAVTEDLITRGILPRKP